MTSREFKFKRGLLCATLAALPINAGAHHLTVVKDLGGASALPYYRALHLVSDPDLRAPVPPALTPREPQAHYQEENFLPVRSALLTPGSVHARVIAAPGLTPLCLVGDDRESRAWLKERLATLQALHAVGLVVEVASYADLAALRRLAPGVRLVPASGNDIARRLGIHHYPVLITSTGIEQ